jgi:hypothetical protein
VNYPKPFMVVILDWLGRGHDPRLSTCLHFPN